MSDKVKERIEKEAIQYEDKNPYDAIHSAYYMGATTERPKAWNDAINKAIETLRYSPGGATAYTLQKLGDLKL